MHIFVIILFIQVEEETKCQEVACRVATKTRNMGVSRDYRVRESFQGETWVNMGVSRDYRVRKSFQGGNTKGETVVYVNLSKGETPRGRLSCT